VLALAGKAVLATLSKQDMAGCPLFHPECAWRVQGQRGQVAAQLDEAATALKRAKDSVRSGAKFANGVRAPASALHPCHSLPRPPRPPMAAARPPACRRRRLPCVAAAVQWRR
jgi:hypothetical protein